jgi:hypothetical protein
MAGTKNCTTFQPYLQKPTSYERPYFFLRWKIAETETQTWEFTRSCRTHKLPKILIHLDIHTANQHLVSTAISCALTKGICSPLQHKLCTWGEEAPGFHSSSISLTLSYKYVVSKCQDPLGRAFLTYNIRLKQKALRFFQFNICFH